MRLTALAIAAAMGIPIAATSPAFAECASGYTQITVPLCQLTFTPAPAFYVSTTGSDSNAGTLAAPFATLSKCQTAMQGSGTKKTCYIRSGSYTPAGLNACNSRGNCAIGLGSSDNGETWSYYPPDGVDSADITGGSTASGNGLWSIFNVGSASNVTFDGLSMHNFDYAAIATGAGASTLTIKDNLIFNGFGIVGDASLTGAQNAGGIQCYSCANMTVAHNAIHDIASFGVSVSSGGTNNLLYDSNVLYNICTAIRDCGALYTQDLGTTLSTNQKITNNYVRDGAVFDTAGWGSAVYLDDCASNWTISGNVFTGENGGNNLMIHGGKNNVFSDNLTDLSTLGNPIARFQSSSCATVTGNSFGGNIIISGNGGGGYNGITGNVTVANNAYFNYGNSGSSFNVGYTTTPTAGSGNSYTANFNFANGPYTMSGTGTIQSCSVWLASGPSGLMQCGIYSAISSSQPGTLLAKSAQFTPAAGWNTASTTTNPSVTSGTSIFMGAVDTVSNATLADANSGFNLYGNNGSTSTLQTTFLNPANVDATTFQLGAYATFNGSGGGTGITSTGDTNPTVEDPQLTCWVYNIASGSPVFNSPVSFTDFTRGWGPPGYTIPHTGTAPSSPHTC